MRMVNETGLSFIREDEKVVTDDVTDEVTIDDESKRNSNASKATHRGMMVSKADAYSIQANKRIACTITFPLILLRTCALCYVSFAYSAQIFRCDG